MLAIALVHSILTDDARHIINARRAVTAATAEYVGAVLEQIRAESTVSYMVITIYS